MVTNIYSITVISSDPYVALGDGTHNRLGIKIKGGVANNRHLSQGSMYFDRNGTGGAGTISCKVRKNSDDSVLYTSPTTLAQNTVTTSPVLYNFTLDYTPNATDGDVIISFESSGSDASNFIVGRTKADTTSNYDKGVYTSSWTFDTSNDFGGQIQSDTWKISVSDALALTETITRAIGAKVSDSLSITESLLESVAKSVADTLSLNDTLKTQVARNITLTDNILTTDIVTMSKVISRSVVDNLSLIDAQGIRKFKTATESIAMTDNLTRNIGRTLADNMNIIDTISKGVMKLFEDDIMINDTTSKSIIKSLIDNVSVIDTIVVAKEITKNILDNMALGDSVTRGISRAISDSPTLTDTLTKAIIKVLQENMIADDTISEQIQSVILVQNRLIKLNSASGTMTEEGSLLSI